MSKAMEESEEGMKRVYIDISEVAFDNVAEAAKKARRSVRQQVAWDIEKMYDPNKSDTQATHA